MAVPQVKDSNYKPTWGGGLVFNASDNGAGVKALYNTIQKNQSTGIPKMTVQPSSHTEVNDNTRVSTVYTPTYRKGQLTNVGGTNKQQVEVGRDNAHKININNIRTQAEKDASYESKSKVLGKYARDAAEAEYRKNNHVSPTLQSDRAVDYDPTDPFLKDAETHQYLKDNNGNLINNSEWDAPMGYRALKTVHDINTGTSMVLSMLPSVTARSIGNAMFIGQNLADIHHDINEGNYTSAGLNTALTFAPYGINKLYKTWKPAKRLQQVVENQYLPYNIMQNRVGAMSDRRNIYYDEIQKVKRTSPISKDFMNKVQERSRNREVDWKSTLEKSKQYRKNWSENIKLFKDPYVNINFNGKDITVRPKVNYYTGEINSGNPEISEYVKDIENTLQGNALVGGSTRLYGSGIINGVPHDLELLTTKSKMGTVKNLIGAKGAQYTSNNGFKQSLLGNNKVWNSDGNHMIDVQIIGQDANGMATGQIAHNYFSRLYPKQYKELQKKWEQLGSKAIEEKQLFNTLDQPLPITADELYTKLQKHPRVYDLMVAMDNYNGFTDKQIGRQLQIFSSPWITNRIQNMNTRAVTDGWNRIKLTPKEIQEVRDYAKIPSVYSNEAVESILNQQLIANNLGIRSVFKHPNYTPVWNLPVENQALRTNVAPFNGQASGIGGNQLLGTSEGGVGGDITAILNNRHDINTFQDYMNAMQHKLKRTDPAYRVFDDINRRVAMGQLSIKEGTKQTEELAKKLGINGFYGSSYAGAKYFGALQQPTVGLKNYSVGAQSGKANFLEVGAYPDFSTSKLATASGTEYSSMGFPQYLLGVRPQSWTRNSLGGWSPKIGAYTYKPKNYNYNNFYMSLPEFRKVIKGYNANNYNWSDFQGKIYQNLIDKFRNASNKYSEYVKLPALLGGVGAGLLDAANNFGMLILPGRQSEHKIIYRNRKQ